MGLLREMADMHFLTATGVQQAVNMAVVTTTDIGLGAQVPLQAGTHFPSDTCHGTWSAFCLLKK